VSLFFLTVFVLLTCFPSATSAQSSETAPFRFSGGFAALSNSFNGLPGSRQPLTGWNASAVSPGWHNLRFKVDVSEFSGNNLGARQRALFILGGAQYEHPIGRERVFAEALFGDGGFNRFWGPNALPGGTASFSELLGGGLDTPVTRHLALRVEADLQHTNLALIERLGYSLPYHVAGLPNYFGHFSAGVVWTPRLEPKRSATDSSSHDASETVQNELILESLDSFGHYHLFAYTWWSYLNVAGVEYDRHSWGNAIGARFDYVAEVLPIVILRQPAQTDVWGDPLSSAHRTVAGLGISPIGIRMLWRDGKLWKPYYTVKGGMIGFTHKALSNYASYENFSLQQTAGIQFRLSDRLDFRAGVSDFHFSNGFLVPNNPGIDEMSWNGGLSIHFGSRSLHF
jgi:hypothetical protein